MASDSNLTKWYRFSCYLCTSIKGWGPKSILA